MIAQLLKKAMTAMMVITVDLKLRYKSIRMHIFWYWTWMKVGPTNMRAQLMM